MAFEMHFIQRQRTKLNTKQIQRVPQSSNYLGIFRKEGKGKKPFRNGRDGHSDTVPVTEKLIRGHILCLHRDQILGNLQKLCSHMTGR